jgi:hypothetical protein
VYHRNRMHFSCLTSVDVSAVIGTSEVFKAELVEPRTGVPAVFALKLAADKSQIDEQRKELWARYKMSESRLHAMFDREKQVLAACGDHPYVIKPLLELCNPSLADGHDVIASELACISVEEALDVSIPELQACDGMKC